MPPVPATPAEALRDLRESRRMALAGMSFLDERKGPVGLLSAYRCAEHAMRDAQAAMSTIVLLADAAGVDLGQQP